MLYPGTSPMVGGNDPNSLEQRKQQLMKQLTEGQGIRNNLSFGGSMGDAPGRSPSLSFNPFFAAIQHMLGANNAGQANNAAVSGNPFFGGGGGPQHLGGNVAQNVASVTGAAAGSAGIGAGGSPAAMPGAPTQPGASPGGFPSIPAPPAGGVTIDPSQAITYSRPTGATNSLFGVGTGQNPFAPYFTSRPLLGQIGNI